MADVPTYRRRADDEKWHFCVNCSTWPTIDYLELQHPEYLLEGSLCLECVTKRHARQCIPPNPERKPDK